MTSVHVMPASAEPLAAQAQRLIRVRQARDLLYGGYTAAGRHRISELMDASAERRPRVEAQVELAAWWYAIGEPLEAARLASEANALAPELLTAENLAIEIDALNAIGRGADARAIIDGLRTAGEPYESEFRLRRCDTFFCDTGLHLNGDRRQIDEWRLAGINAVFESVGLCAIELRDPVFPLSIGNVVGTVAPASCGQGGPLVSVIVPVNDSADTLEFALRSIMAQTWSNLEIVVVDDGSRDSTLDVAERLSLTDSRVVLVPRTKRGAYAARNHGLARSTGDFITVHDGDDWSHPQKIQRQVEQLLDEPWHRANWSSWIRAEETLRFRESALRPNLRRITNNYSSAMYERAVFDQLGIWDEVRVSADNEFLQRVRAFYGDEAVARVMPGAPLAFGLKSSASLTGSGRTGMQTLYHVVGPRRQYHEAYRHWHRSPQFRADLPVVPGKDARPFAVPPAMELGSSAVLSYDLVLMADLSDHNVHVAPHVELARGAADVGCRVGLVNVPGARSGLTLHPDVLAVVASQGLGLVSAGDEVRTGLALAWGVHNLCDPLDDRPRITADRTGVVVDGPSARIASDPDFMAAIDDELLRFGLTDPVYVAADAVLRRVLVAAGRDVSRRVADAVLGPVCAASSGLVRAKSTGIVGVIPGPDVGIDDLVRESIFVELTSRFDVSVAGGHQQRNDVLARRPAWEFFDLSHVPIAEFARRVDVAVCLPTGDSCTPVAMAAAVAAEGTPVLEVKGLGEPFDDIFGFCEPDGLSDLVDALLRDIERRDRAGRTAAALVGQRFSAGSVHELLEAAIVPARVDRDPGRERRSNRPTPRVDP